MNAFTKRFRNFVTDVISGIGTVDDPGSRFIISTDQENYTYAEIISAYTKSGQIQRAIDLIPTSASQYIYKDAKRKIIDIDPAVDAELSRLDFRNLALLASISARLFAESYLMIITDSDRYDVPLAENEIIFELMPLERDQISFEVNDLQQRDYRLRVNIESEFKNIETDIPVHSSRILMFAGKYYPNRVKSAYAGYNGSVIGGLLTSYGTYRHSLNMSISLLSRMATFVLKLAGLQDYISTSNANGLSNRLSMLKRFIGSVGGFIIDAKTEELDWLQINLSNVPEIINQHAKQFSAESELTHDQFWNEGSNDTASAIEEINYLKRVENFLSIYWQDNFNRLYRHLTLYQDTTPVYLGMNYTENTTQNTEAPRQN